MENVYLSIMLIIIVGLLAAVIILIYKNKNLSSEVKGEQTLVNLDKKYQDILSRMNQIESKVDKSYSESNKSYSSAIAIKDLCNKFQDSLSPIATKLNTIYNDMPSTFGLDKKLAEIVGLLRFIFNGGSIEVNKDNGEESVTIRETKSTSINGIDDIQKLIVAVYSEISDIKTEMSKPKTTRSRTKKVE